MCASIWVGFTPGLFSAVRAHGSIPSFWSWAELKSTRLWIFEWSVQASKQTYTHMCAMQYPLVWSMLRLAPNNEEMGEKSTFKHELTPYECGGMGTNTSEFMIFSKLIHHALHVCLSKVSTTIAMWSQAYTFILQAMIRFIKCHGLTFMLEVRPWHLLNLIIACSMKV